jgi:hypothetical protein
MKVVILEVCRSPEIKKQTEALILSRFFTEQQIEYDLYSNDTIWPERTEINKYFIEQCLNEPDIGVVHLAMHGDARSFVLKWSHAEEIGRRVPEDLLTGPDIMAIPDWSGKLVVSGACSSATLAHYFLHAGAAAVIAPTIPIDWTKLGAFFSIFYTTLFEGQKARIALDRAIAQFPEFRSYRIYTNA